jgi:hypothetical protein
MLRSRCGVTRYRDRHEGGGMHDHAGTTLDRTASSLAAIEFAGWAWTGKRTTYCTATGEGDD